jgi:hypothetical protein
MGAPITVLVAVSMTETLSLEPFVMYAKGAPQALTQTPRDNVTISENKQILFLIAQSLLFFIGRTKNALTYCHCPINPQYFLYGLCIIPSKTNLGANPQK